MKMAIVFLLIFVNAFFVAAEFAIVKMRSSRLETLIQEGHRRAGYAKEIIDHIDVALSVTQLGITLASLGLGWLGEPVVSAVIQPLFEMLGIGGSLRETISFLLAFSLITAFLAMAPGGIAEMSLAGMSMGENVSIILTYQLVRLLAINICVPPLLKWWFKPKTA